LRLRMPRPSRRPARGSLFSLCRTASRREFAAPLLEAGLRVIDLSADFRLKDAEVYRNTTAPRIPLRLLGRAVYGMPELYRKEIRAADLVASPGCYPTSRHPSPPSVAQGGLIDPGSIVITSLSAVSGAGRKAELDYSFVECNESVRAYSVPSIGISRRSSRELTAAAGQTVTVNFTPILIPINRGILTTIYARPSAESPLAASGGHE